MYIGELLREERMAQGLSVRSLAKMAGVSPQTVINLETDANSPKVATAEAVARALGCEIRLWRG